MGLKVMRYIALCLVVVFGYLLIVFPIHYHELNWSEDLDFDLSALEFVAGVEGGRKFYGDALKVKNGDFYFNHPMFRFPPITDLTSAFRFGRFKDDLFANNTHELYAHSLVLLPDLVTAHRETDDDQLLQKGLEIIVRWIKENPRFSLFQSRYAWGDHSTSNRIINILNFIGYAKEHVRLTDDFYRMVKGNISDSFLFLINPLNYKNNNNHGLFQDFALAKILGVMKDGEAKRRALNILASRFNDQVLSTYSSKGVHLENSPGYHIQITELAFKILGKISSLGGYSLIDGRVTKLLKKAKYNYWYFVGFDGEVPPIGDSIPYSLDASVLDQKAPPILIDTESGYVVIKQEPVYLVVRTQSKYLTHRHADNMSFFLEVGGETIFRDGGFLNYTNSVDRSLTLSQSAHNVVAINGNSKYSNSVIDEVGTINNLVYRIRLSTKLSARSVAVRTIVLDLLSGVFNVSDRLHGAGDTNWEIYLNLGSNIGVSRVEGNLYLLDSPNRRLFLRHMRDSDFKRPDIVRGDRVRKLGWCAKAFDSLYPCTTLFFQGTGGDMVNNIALTYLEGRACPIHSDSNYLVREARSYTSIFRAGAVGSEGAASFRRNRKVLFYERLNIFVFNTLLLLFSLVMLYIFIRVQTVSRVRVFWMIIGVYLSYSFMFFLYKYCGGFLG